MEQERDVLHYSIVLKYLVCLPGVQRHHKALINPYVINTFWRGKMCSETSNTGSIELSAFKVRLIQAAKCKSRSCSRKKPFCELLPICYVLLASKFGKRELVLDLQCIRISCIDCHVSLCVSRSDPSWHTFTLQSHAVDNDSCFKALRCLSTKRHFSPETFWLLWRGIQFFL